MEILYRFLDTGSKTDVSQWLDLYSIGFHQEISSDFCDHIHMKNPFYTKTKPLIFIAETDRKIVGSLSLIPSPVKEYRENTVNTYKSLLLCKAMVHPDYRKKGIFSQLLRNAVETAESEDYDVLLTFSNNLYSYQSFIGIGFQDVASMRWSRLFLSRDNTFSAYINSLHFPKMIEKALVSSFFYCYCRLKPKSVRSYQTKYGDINECIDDIETFQTSIQPVGGIYGIRTTSFLRWKFIRDDAFFKCFSLWEEGKMLGYTVVQLYYDRKNAYIVDICCSKNQKSLISAMIGEVSTWLQENNFQELWAYRIENDTMLSKFFLLHNGFLRRTSKAGKLKKTRFLVYPLNSKITQTSCLDKNSWNIQSVDTCLFLE